jgi:hypothetical protein
MPEAAVKVADKQDFLRTVAVALLVSVPVELKVSVSQGDELLPPLLRHYLTVPRPSQWQLPRTFSRRPAPVSALRGPVSSGAQVLGALALADQPATSSSPSNNRLPTSGSVFSSHPP